jgi:hypothetical protein
MFFNENLNRFYPFDTEFISQNRADYSIGQLELLRSGIIDFGLVLYKNTRDTDLWTNGLLEGSAKTDIAEIEQPVIQLKEVQGKQVVITADGIDLTFHLTRDFETQVVYFENGYGFLTAGIAASLIDTVFNPAVLFHTERVITTAKNQLTSVNGITDSTLVFQNGVNSRCYITGNDVYVTTSVPPMSSNIEGLITFMGAKGRNIVITTDSELSVMSEGNVVTISINEDMFNSLNCNAD